MTPRQKAERDLDATASPMDEDELSEALEANARNVLALDDALMAANARIKVLEAFGAKVSAIMDSICGIQSFHWSEHAYPLRAALDEAGFPGKGYEIARKDIVSLIRNYAAAAEALSKIEDMRHDEDCAGQLSVEMCTCHVGIARKARLGGAT